MKGKVGYPVIASLYIHCRADNGSQFVTRDPRDPSTTKQVLSAVSTRQERICFEEESSNG